MEIKNEFVEQLQDIKAALNELDKGNDAHAYQEYEQQLVDIIEGEGNPNDEERNIAIALLERIARTFRDKYAEEEEETLVMLYYYIANGFDFIGKYPRAVEYYTRILKISPHEPNVLDERGYTHQRWHRHDQARQDHVDAHILRERFDNNEIPCGYVNY